MAKYKVERDMDQVSEHVFAGATLKHRSFGIGSDKCDFGAVIIVFENLLRSEGGSGGDPPMWETVDDQGWGPRTVGVKGRVIPNWVLQRPQTPASSSGYDTTDHLGQDKGHLMALQNGGPNVAKNIVPQWAHWQRHDEWRKMETTVHGAATKCWELSSGKAEKTFVYFDVEVIYPALPTAGADGFFTQQPTLRSWSYPKKFRVKSYQCDLKGNSKQINVLDSDQKDGYYELEGFPDNYFS